ncbi:hypothetical protein NDU88_003636 [Pleurodeles waltl]|uniref:Uncharacterized protein n=1 Tax=Pleurodeles waltl TaxID=8319 RepID=A0AAV7MW64_PLEWA|nr:hypothetical protein NDU88_003636 [Pleurodeles waltl]
MHCSTYSGYSRGVEILLRKGLQWRTKKVLVDPNGRNVLMSGVLLDKACRLVAVYGPNVDDPGFFLELWTREVDHLPRTLSDHSPREMAEIESGLAELERRLASHWSSDVLAEIRREVSLYEEISLREICFLGREARARQYGEGERAGRTLAALLRKPWASDYVSEIMDGEGGSMSGSGGVMQVFTEFYTRLYAALACASATDAQVIFENIALVWFDEGQDKAEGGSKPQPQQVVVRQKRSSDIQEYSVMLGAVHLSHLLSLGQMVAVGAAYRCLKG